VATAALRVGVIGSGFGARVVAPAFAAVDGVEVAEVVSARDAGAVTALCARTDLDLVSVQSPPFLHVWHVQQAAAGGHAVLCDKPVGVSAAEAADALAAVEASRVAHFLNVEFRCDPVRAATRDAIQAGLVGTVTRIEWVHRTGGSLHPLRPYGWLFDGARGGGFVGAWASHAIDFLRWAVGEPQVVSSQRRLDIASRPDADGIVRECTAEDGFDATLVVTTSRGDVVEARLEATFAAVEPAVPTLTITGENGTLVNVGDLRLELYRDGERTLLAEAGASTDRHAEPMGRYAARVIQAVRARDLGDLATLADAVAIARVLDALRVGPLTTSG